jgi:DNA-binding MarR family transcriptional regulator
VALSSDSAGSSRRAQLLGALDVAFRTSSAQSVMLSQAAADRLGMASSDIECYDLLSLHGPMTAGRLAELTGLTTGAITGVIDRLERAGYAARERDPNDRRRVIVQPNMERHADEAAIAAYGPVAAAMERLLARYSDDELDVILDFFTRANAELHAHITHLRSETRTSKGGERVP